MSTTFVKEDCLYPAAYFVTLEVPETVKNAFSLTAYVTLP
jgi:hypothetical protein